MSAVYLNFHYSMKKFILPLILIFNFSACSDYVSNKGEKIKLNQTITDLYIFGAKEGTARWVLQSKKAEILENNSKADLLEPVIYFKENGKNISRIRAKKGLMDIDKKTVTLLGKVYVNSFTEDLSLKTQKLNYSFDKDKFHTNSRVTVTRDKVVVVGEGFEAKSDLSEIAIYNQRTQIPQK